MATDVPSVVQLLCFSHDPSGSARKEPSSLFGLVARAADLSLDAMEHPLRLGSRSSASILLYSLSGRNANVEQNAWLHGFSSCACMPVLEALMNPRFRDTGLISGPNTYVSTRTGRWLKQVMFPKLATSSPRNGRDHNGHLMSRFVSLFTFASAIAKKSFDVLVSCGLHDLPIHLKYCLLSMCV